MSNFENDVYLFFLQQQHFFWYCNNIFLLITEHSMTPVPIRRPTPYQRVACSIWSVLIGGFWSSGPAREGRHCCGCSAATNLITLEILVGIYTLLRPRGTLQTDKLEAQVGLPTIARRSRRIPELKQYQQPQKLSFFKLVYGCQRCVKPFLIKKHFL